MSLKGLAISVLIMILSIITEKKTFQFQCDEKRHQIEKGYILSGVIINSIQRCHIFRRVIHIISASAKCL